VARWAYDPLIGFSMRRPEIVLTLAAGALASALTLLPRLGSEFLPELNEGRSTSPSRFRETCR